MFWLSLPFVFGFHLFNSLIYSSEGFFYIAIVLLGQCPGAVTSSFLNWLWRLLWRFCGRDYYRDASIVREKAQVQVVLSVDMFVSRHPGT